MNLTKTGAARIEQVPRMLKAEFPTVPLEVIEHDVEDRVRRLVAGASFDDFVPLLAQRAVRERLRALN